MVDRQLPLSGAARPWIERVSVATYASDVGPYPWIHAPDPATTLVWRRTENGYGALRVVGPRTRAAYHPSKDIPLCIQVRINIGFVSTVLGIAARDVVAPATVSEVARQVGVSERQLRNLFAATVGLPPKQFARLNRIRTVLDRTGRQPWARLASDAGYYDQSHMTADFQQIMQVTPGQFAAGQFPVVPCRS